MDYQYDYLSATKGSAQKVKVRNFTATNGVWGEVISTSSYGNISFHKMEERETDFGDC